MQQHEMTLYQGPFERMIRGEKTLELRLYDEKRQKIQAGDKITFKLASQPEKKIATEVTALLIYQTFANLIDDLPTSLLGYKEEDRGYLRESMYEIYTPEQEAKHGALGIRLKLV